MISLRWLHDYINQQDLSSTVFEESYNQACFLMVIINIASGPLSFLSHYGILIVPGPIAFALQHNAQLQASEDWSNLPLLLLDGQSYQPRIKTLSGKRHDAQHFSFCTIWFEFWLKIMIGNHEGARWTHLFDRFLLLNAIPQTQHCPKPYITYHTCPLTNVS